MTLARTRAVALTGVRAHLVEVQADLSQGLPGMGFTGLADTSVTESRDRIRAALVNSGAGWPQQRITVALLPADLRKSGSRFDLAVAVAVLACGDNVRESDVSDVGWIAELGLDGRLRPVNGVLPSVAALRENGIRRVVVAAGNGAEAALVPDMDVRVARDLREIVDWLAENGPAPRPPEPATGEAPRPARLVDLADVAGQTLAKRALEVAAAGSHHVFLEGPPGSGKTMLAERMPGLLPPLDDETSVEVTAVHSVAGLLDERARLITEPPLQAPHHTASIASLVGGGAGMARPGAISLAHRGVLFLDEAPEFGAKALDSLRQPLESGLVLLSRSGGTISYPARFLLVLAANPCPCGKTARDCVCLAHVRRRYQQRLSGPLLDRVDVRVSVEQVPHAELVDLAAERETTAQVAVRVAVARAAAAERWSGTRWRGNGEVPGNVLRARPWALPRATLAPAEEHLRRGQLSARGFDRVLRLSWSIADLAGHTTPDATDVAEAMFFRTGDTAGFAA